MPKEKDPGELARWLTFIFAIMPMLPVVIIAFILGVAWSIAKECFVSGTNVLGVWDNYDPDEKKS